MAKTTKKNNIKIILDPKQFQQIQYLHIRRCQNCQAILHQKDKQWLWSIQDYKNNYDLFDTEFRLTDIQNIKNIAKNIKIWICRFCGKHQKIVQDMSTYFMEKPLQIKKPQSQQNIKNKQPIILFLIDWSSSMQQVILTKNLKKNNTNVFKKKPDSTQQSQNQQAYFNVINDSQLVKQFKLLQASIAKQAQQIVNKQEAYIVREQQQYICKNHLLLSIIEKVIKQMKMKQQQSLIKRKIGFIFFNDFIFFSSNFKKESNFITGSNPHTKLNLKILEKLKKQNNSFKDIQYQDYSQSFNFGKQIFKQYNEYLKDFEVSQMVFQKLYSSGQTALGPAIAVALGIISQNDQGSTIMAITDGNSNNGILSSELQEDKIMPDIRKIVQDLKKYKCKLGVLQWKSQNQKNKNYLDLIKKQEPSLLTKIEVNLKIRQIGQYSKCIISLAYQFRIDTQIQALKCLHNVDFISLQASNKRFQKQNQPADLNLWAKQNVSCMSPIWMTIKIDQKKIEEFYFQNQPIFTQLQITTRKIDTNEEVCYVSQIQQYLTKNIQQSIKLLNFSNLNERMLLYNIEGNSLKFDTKSFSSFNSQIMNKSHKVKDSENLSRYATAVQNQINFTQNDYY